MLDAVFFQEVFVWFPDPCQNASTGLEDGGVVLGARTLRAAKLTTDKQKAEVFKKWHEMKKKLKKHKELGPCSLTGIAVLRMAQ